MAGKSSFFMAGAGWKLHIESWTPPTTPRLAVLFLHGVNESAETLTCRRLAGALTQAGISFHALEQHGHGLSVECNGSEQPLGLIQSFDLLIAHAVEACCEVASGKEHIPLVLMGHSLGAAVAACAFSSAAERLSAHNNARLVAGVFIAPPIVLTSSQPWITHTALRGAACVMPSLPIGPPEHPEMYCPPDVAPPGRNYDGKMRARTALEFLDFDGDGFEQRVADGEFGDLPFLVVLGTEDSVVSPDSCDPLLAAGSRGEVLMLEGSGHQPIAVDRNWESTVSRIVSWLQQVGQL